MEITIQSKLLTANGTVLDTLSIASLCSSMEPPFFKGGNATRHDVCALQNTPLISLRTARTMIGGNSPITFSIAARRSNGSAVGGNNGFPENNSPRTQPTAKASAGVDHSKPKHKISQGSDTIDACQLPKETSGARYWLEPIR